MLDLNSKSGLSDRINFLVDAGISSHVDENPRNYLGCSAIGGSCERSVEYEALSTVFRDKQTVIALPDAVGKTFPPRTRRIFTRGHVVEDCAAEWLRRAGLVLETKNPLTDEQFEISFLGGRVLGHCDGIFVHWLGDGAAPFQLPALWECKCLGHKWANALRRDGVKRSHPKYFGQMQLYMGGLHLRRGILTAVDADTMELVHEQVDFDEDEYRSLLVRAEHVLTCAMAGELVPRCASTPADVNCKMCHWSETCWKE